MSQTLVPAVNRNEIVLFQDLYFVKKRMPIKSTVIEVVCTICDKGLDEGVSVTAKKIGQRISLFCQHHLPKDT